MKKKIGILGSTGYTGYELLQLLRRHPEMEISWLTSERHAGKSVFELFPQLRGIIPELIFIPSAEAQKNPVDGVFSCLPHQTAAEGLLPFLESGTAKIVDLSADFRMQDPAIYEKYYSAHPCPQWQKEAVYGLCEWNANDIANKRIIGNPGCYPTSILVPLKPLIEKSLISTQGIIADSKSGVSGAGKSPSATTHFCEVHENFSAYKVGNEHRHLSEINEQLSLAAGSPVNVVFTPHLVPMERGILSTIYAPLNTEVSRGDVLKVFHEAYGSSPFVDVLDDGFPKTDWVRGTNRCLFGFKVVQEQNLLIVVSVIDNLIKGASGQALQNMNIALGLPQESGLL